MVCFADPPLPLVLKEMYKTIPFQCFLLQPSPETLCIFVVKLLWTLQRETAKQNCYFGTHSDVCISIPFGTQLFVCRFAEGLHIFPNVLYMSILLLLVCL